MALVYCDQLDGSVTAIEDDVLIVVRPRSDVEFTLEVWLGEEEPAYSSVAMTLEEAKNKVQNWLAEALS